MTTVKRLIELETTSDYALYGKTGWARPDGRDIGWFVGWVERDGNAYIFAARLDARRDAIDIKRLRRGLATAILEDLGLL
jgi:beta-lactamase class D